MSISKLLGSGANEIGNGVFPFLTLPSELRLHIYSHVFPTSFRISPVRPSYERLVNPWALTSVCHLIRHEVLSFVYSTSIFHIHFHDTLTEAYEDWIEQLDERLANLVRNIVFDGDVEIKWKYPKTKLHVEREKKNDIKRQQESIQIWYGYQRGHRSGNGLQRTLKDQIGDWEVFWQDEETRSAKSSMLSVLTENDRQRKGTNELIPCGLGKEGIRRLVAAYRSRSVNEGGFVYCYNSVAKILKK
ncbi:MAG: hypothetical protein Q9209_006951 [Squamulea sp. 1 TL-2023]